MSTPCFAREVDMGYLFVSKLIRKLLSSGKQSVSWDASECDLAVVVVIHA